VVLALVLLRHRELRDAQRELAERERADTEAAGDASAAAPVPAQA
jgi:hypothetical protein